MAAKEFFDALPSRAGPEQIAGVDNSYLFDIAGEGRWLVEVRDGTVKVTEGWEGPADVTFKTSPEMFERLASGKQNPMTAYLTGKIKVEGDIRAAMALQNIL
jgi:putative sterol carrier protein